MILVLCLLSSVFAEQAPIISEEFSDPECYEKLSCEECSFNQFRSIEACFKSGYIQTVLCKMTSNLNNVQEISYKSACSPNSRPVLSFYQLFWLISILTTTILYFNWSRLKASKIQTQETSLANIIKT